MEDQSPPKRVTRSRAAAKATDTAPPKMKIATAATKVKASRAAATTTTTTKRKTRADDNHDEDQVANDEEHREEPMEKKKSETARTTRGRAKKPVQEDQDPVAQEPSAPSTCGRPKKTATEAPPEPTRTTRGRPKKADTAAEAPAAAFAEEPVKKIARGGRTAITKAPAMAKKNVTFEDKHDLDKENKLPTRAVRGKAKDAEEPTGLRAKPIRKPAAAAPRTTRGRAKTVTEPEQPEVPAQKSSPLSPKKVTQIATANPSSDDELSTMHKTPMKSLTRSPIKPPGSMLDQAKKLDFTTSITVNRMTTDLNNSLLRSPARKVPQSAFMDLNSPARKAPQVEYKDSMKESPRKLNLGDSLHHAPFKASAPGASSAKSPFKASLLQSPARRPPSPMKTSTLTQPENNTSALFGATPNVSKFKISRFTTPKTTSKSTFRTTQPEGESIVRPNTAVGSRFKTSDGPRSQHFPTAAFPGRLSAIVPRDVDPVASPAKVQPTSQINEPLAEKPASIQEEEISIADEPITEDSVKEDPMLATEGETFKDEIALFQNSTRSTTPPSPPPSDRNPSFELRLEDPNPFQDSDSEDELASNSPKYSPASLSPQNIATQDFAKMPQTPNPSFDIVEDNLSGHGGTIRAQRQQIGFTPLARQLSDWMGASPEKNEDSDSSNSEQGSPSSKDIQNDNQGLSASSPSKGGFFDDEMLVRDNENLIEDVMDVDGEVVLSEVEPDDEDMALAAEADEMSLIGLAELDAILDAENKPELDFALDAENKPKLNPILDTEDVLEGLSEECDIMATPAKSVSACSQEYGDENDTPIDPALLSQDAQLPHTPLAVQPRRCFERVSHTVSKVPLKPAAEESPIKYSPMKRSASVSRVPAQRGDGQAVGRSNTAFSFSPSKRTMKSRQDQPLQEILDEISTPESSKGTAPQTPWSSAATPARTPRRDLNEQLLKGAVVYVDVHTTEGADASGIFVELLTQMGAKCVKTWTWNPNHSSNSPESDASSAVSKIGITHVVFKDGGKRTLEKIRESNGIVLCVGVGWVLDCERENSWLEESLYAVDTSLIPRGGHKRRKSMEPKALANLNGTLVPSFTPSRPSMPPAKGFRNLNTPAINNRRASREWVRSPSGSSPEELAALEALERDLLPVPATPAPVISAYSESLLDEDDKDTEPSTPYFLHPKDLVQMTCPPKKTSRDVFDELDVDGEVKEALGHRTGDGDNRGVMARLLMARRKSLQFAPKVGSPLAREG